MHALKNLYLKGRKTCPNMPQDLRLQKTSTVIWCQGQTEDSKPHPST